MIQVNIRKFSFYVVFSIPISCKNRLINTRTMSALLPGALDNTTLKPPSDVKNMKTLNRAAFSKDFTVPCVKFKTGQISLEKVKPILGSFLLKIPNFKSISQEPEFTTIYLKPSPKELWAQLSDEAKVKLKALDINEESFCESTLQLTYDNWNYVDVLKAILPDDKSIPRSFSRIGHIIHLNLRDDVLEYKEIIGQVLLDKVPNVKSIVNKTNIIDQTFRNFSMEVICGDDDMITQVKENGVTYAFDFSKVYWNPRLSTEHERVTSKLKSNDVLFDVFCGVGPFAIPCAKKKCLVFANDLNPDSISWLKHNVKLNKINDKFIKIYNKDGAEFIKNDIKEELQLLSKESEDRTIYVTMNLPAAALEFVKYFHHLFKRNEITDEKLVKIVPIIYVYFFTLGTDYTKTAVDDFKQHTGLTFNSEDMKLDFVRNVAPNKDMVKITFKPPLDFLLDEDLKSSCEEPKAKKICME